ISEPAEIEEPAQHTENEPSCNGSPHDRFLQDFPCGASNLLRSRACQSILPNRRSGKSEIPSRLQNLADQSPNEMPTALAVSITSLPGSTRLGWRRASVIGMVTIFGGCSATISPQRWSATARTAAPPKRGASRP